MVTVHITVLDDGRVSIRSDISPDNLITTLQIIGAIEIAKDSLLHERWGYIDEMVKKRKEKKP